LLDWGAPLLHMGSEHPIPNRPFACHA
jgi:hypothetical protein